MQGDGTRTRRRLLAGVGAVAGAALAGCSDRLWNQAEHSPPEQVSLTVKTLPADDDGLAARIASHLTQNFQAAGIDSVHEPVAETELYREILLDEEYELFVAKHPGLDDFDALRSLLHSQFVTESGWQNPFGFSNVRADALLERQSRERGYDRLSTVSDLFEHLVQTAPYTTVAFPTDVGVVRSELAVQSPPETPLEYADIASRRTERDEDGPLRVGVLEYAFTERLNPLFVGLGEASTVLKLLYDPLFRVLDGTHRPWLAANAAWDDAGGELAATVELREGLIWHDGEPLVAEDVAFTATFLDDTSLGGAESGVPAPQYRGMTTLIEGVEVLDDRRVRFSFGNRSREVARRALTVPVFPEHVWAPKSRLVDDYLTEALVWNNNRPVGSGLYRFDSRTAYETVRVTPFPDHALYGVDEDWFPDVSPDAADVEFRVSPNAGAAVDSLVDGDLELLGSSLPPDDVGRVRDAEELNLVESPSRSFYVVGFNVRHPELGNPHFRWALSHLIDREYVVDEFFDGYARPAMTQNALRGVPTSSWEFPTAAGVPEFPGEDGEIDAETARDLFREIGYRYDDGELLS